jgi:hypothetical protein
MEQNQDQAIAHSYANKTRGFTNEAMLICTFLRNKCIRLDQDYWIAKIHFIDNSTLSDEVYASIASKIQDRLCKDAFLPLGLLPASFFDELPEIKLYDKILYWNSYLLTSMGCHLIESLRVVNDEPSPYAVTAMAVPHNAVINNGVVEYVLEIYKKSSMVANSANEIFEYLLKNQVRMRKSKELLEKIRTMFGVE